MGNEQLAWFAVRQHGLVTREQARAAGVSRSGWYRRLAAGRLVEVRPRVAALQGAPPTTEQTVLAAVLSLGDGAVASHRSAAHLWGGPVAGDDPVDVTVRPSVGAHRPGVVVHRPLDGHQVRSVLRAGIPTTTPTRTLLELGAVCPSPTVGRFYEHLLIAGIVTSAGVQTTLDQHARRGRDGVGALRTVLDEWALGDRPPDSALEAAMGRLLRAHALPPPAFQHVVRGPGFRYRVDFAYADLRIVVEVDGWRYHGSRAAFEADRRRDVQLQNAGWMVLRFTWLQITRRPAWVAAQIATAVASRSF